MAENSGISWTDHTFNPWLGCTNVSPGCDHCYAEKLCSTRLGVQWGDDALRRRTRPGNWAKVRSWNRHADDFRSEHGHFPRVFSASLADIFDNKVDPAWRADFWELVANTPKLQWLIVTKRSGNVEKMLPKNWSAIYQHVVLIFTVVNQAEANRDVPRLLKIKNSHPWLRVGLSIEPMLGPIDLTNVWPDATATLNALTGEARHLLGDRGKLAPLDWVITGGESKQLEGARPLVPLHERWVRDIDAQCAAAGVPHHFKQWGHTIPESQFIVGPNQDGMKIVMADDPQDPPTRRAVYQAWMGRFLDGDERNGFPPPLLVAA